MTTNTDNDQTPTRFYAGDVAHSGFVTFDSEAERDAWIAEHNGFVIEARQIDPTIR